MLDGRFVYRAGVNLASIIEVHPDDAVAVVHGDRVVTYGELRQRVASARGTLGSWGIGPGDRVALALGNDPSFVVTYLAVLGIGAVAVPLDPQSPAIELADGVRRTGSRLLVGDVPGIVADQLDASIELCPSGALIAAGRTTTPDAVVDRDPDDLAVLVFTSGTSGAPRPAKLTHGNLLANLEQVQSSPGRRQHADDVVLGAIPLFHVFGLNVVLGAALVAGARAVLLDRFAVALAVDAIRDHGVTVLAGPPAMWTAFADFDGTSEVSDRSGPPRSLAKAFSSVRIAVSGADKLDPAVAVRLRERLGVHVDEGYGLTEASPVVTAATGTAAPLGSIGLPLPGVEVRVVDVNGTGVVVGDVGELWVRGPNVFPGYLDDPEATAAVLVDGWLRTGDLAVVDGDGFLFLVGRAKDLVVVSGFNVHPGEVEQVLASHPAIADAAVVGVPDARTGEAVVAYVVLRTGEPGVGDELSADDVEVWCLDRLARYKVPTRIELVDALPRNAAGKVVRGALG